MGSCTVGHKPQETKLLRNESLPAPKVLGRVYPDGIVNRKISALAHYREET